MALYRQIALGSLLLIGAGSVSAQFSQYSSPTPFFPGQANEQQQSPGGAGLSFPSGQAPQAPVITGPRGGTSQNQPGFGQAFPLVPAIPERNEFQDFIQLTTGKKVPIFGQALFENPSNTFAPVEDIPVPPDYVMGPGDELLVRAWGQIEIDYRAQVDRNGTISIPRIGSIPVAGVRYQDLTQHLRAAISKTFRNFELVVTMGQLRAVRVFVVGNARRPGTYTVSSLSTLINAIFAAGGPSTRGSMRSIQLKRGNQVITDLDLYDLLINGDKSKDASLQPGDVIYFAPVGSLVAVMGSVNNEAIFEPKGSTTLEQLLRYAGGLSTLAQARRITVERIVERSRRAVEQVDLDASASQRPVMNGDVVTVLPIALKFDNAVTLRGNVAQPLRYPYREGMRIRDLIPDKDALVTRDYYLRRNMIVNPVPEQNPIYLREALSLNDSAKRDKDLATSRDLVSSRELRDQNGTRDSAGSKEPTRTAAGREVQQDVLISRDPATGHETVVSKDPVTGRERVIVRDPVTGREVLSAREGLSAQRFIESVRNLSDEINWDYAVIERQRDTDYSMTLIPFNLGKAVLEGDAAHNLPLKPGDVVTVFSKRDLSTPVDRRPVVVHLDGEFGNAGVYQALPGETLRQLVTRAGGVTQKAYLFGAELTRESTRAQQQERLQRAIDQLEQDLQRATITRSQSAVSAEDAAGVKTERDAQQGLVSRLRALKPTGRIVLETPENAKLADIADLPLEDGDRFYIPPIPSMVSVFGTVFNEASFVYQPEKTFDQYLRQAGGPRKEADEGSIYVIRANGSVLSRRQTAGFFTSSLGGERLMPGDAIVVPEDFTRTTLTRTLKDWAQILYQLGLGVAALKVLGQ